MHWCINSVCNCSNENEKPKWESIGQSTDNETKTRGNNDRQTTTQNTED